MADNYNINVIFPILVLIIVTDLKQSYILPTFSVPSKRSILAHKINRQISD
jgi:hypothetical protein